MKSQILINAGGNWKRRDNANDGTSKVKALKVDVDALDLLPPSLEVLQRMDKTIVGFRRRLFNIAAVVTG